MQIYNDTFLSCNRRTKIHTMIWQPDTGVPVRGIVMLSHGVAEHVRRYEDFAAFLTRHGFLVAGNDHIGHGESVEGVGLGSFGLTGGWAVAVGDMHQFHTQLLERYPRLPCFLFGHSMGSFLSRTYIIRYRLGLDGVIFSGTGHQSRAVVNLGKAAAERVLKRRGAAYQSPFLNKLAFGSYNKGFAGRTLFDWLSRDEAEVDRYMEDPLCGFVPAASIFAEMMKGIAYITNPQNQQRMRKDLPVLFLSGDADPVGENGRGVMRAYRSFLDVGMEDVSLKLYHEGRHEMLHERNKAEVYADILSWLEGKLEQAEA